MTQRLSFTKIKKQVLPPTEGWDSERWIHFFQEEGIYTDFATLEVIKKYLNPTTGVEHTIFVDAQPQGHVVVPPSIETICMFRKYFSYSQFIKTFGVQRVVALYHTKHPQGMQIIIGHCSQYDFLVTNPLHNNSSIAATSGVLYEE